MKRRYDEWLGVSPPETPWADSVLQGLRWASEVYRSGVRLRTWAYRRGVFRRFALGVPVVSVGNVTAGGTGKTPLVMFLAERFQAEGARVVILSRGYMRQGKGVIVVTDGDRVLARKRRAGDEPYLMGLRLRRTRPPDHVEEIEERVLRGLLEIGIIHNPEESVEPPYVAKRANCAGRNPTRCLGLHQGGGR